MDVHNCINLELSYDDGDEIDANGNDSIRIAIRDGIDADGNDKVSKAAKEK